MREKDTVTKSYLSDSERFAQLFNIAIFHGNPILDPKKLKDLNPTESVSLSPKMLNSNNQRFSKELYTLRLLGKQTMGRTKKSAGNA